MADTCLSTRRVLAHGPFCSIEECSCGVLHATFGPFTIRLQPEIAESMWMTLGEAIQRLALEQHRGPLSQLDASVSQRPTPRGKLS